MKQRTRNRALACLAVVAVVIALALAFLSTPARGPVAMVVVDRGTVEDVIRAAGRSHMRQRCTILAPLDGYLPLQPWHAGDRVRAGDVLLQMQPAHAPFDPLAHDNALANEARAREKLEVVQANTEAARLHVEFAETQHARIEQAFSTGNATREDLDLAGQVLADARRHLHEAEFAITIARHEFDTAELRANRTREDSQATGPVPMRTPLGGVVLSVTRQSGSDEMITAGTPLLEIGDPATLEIHVDVTTAEALRLERNAEARIFIAPDNARPPLEGRVRRIEPAAFTTVNARGDEEQRVRVAVELTSSREQWPRLGDGYPVSVEFIAWRGTDAVRIPTGALYRQEDRWMVFRVQGGRAYGTPVAVGHRGERYAEVLHGLAPDDVLVLDPGTVTDGARVVP